jgi:hypothetical protein
MQFLELLLSMLAATLPATAMAQQDVASLMKAIVVPASDGVFVAGKTPPKTDADWAAVVQNAEKLAAAAQPLAAIPPPNAKPDWARYASGMGNAARAAANAAREKNLDHVMDAGDELYDTCEGCHKVYLKR